MAKDGVDQGMVPSSERVPVCISHGTTVFQIEPVPLHNVPPAVIRIKRLVVTEVSAQLRPNTAAYVIAGLYMLLGVVPLIYLALSSGGRLAFLAPAIIGSMLAGMVSRLLYGFSLSFDKRRGEVRIRNLFRRWRLPLREIVAVQLVPGENVQVLPLVWKPAYQLNVIVNHPELVTINLGHYPALAWMRKSGKQLAEFLQVPLVDQIPSMA